MDTGSLPAMPGSVALVTDSTASLPADVVAAREIRVVPLQVVIGPRSYAEGVDPELTPPLVAQALREWQPVSTSRPNPEEILEVYDAAVAAGAEEIVSVHLSGEMSGTFESAQLAARQCSVPVHTVDSRQVGIATGFAVLAAADTLDAGASASAAAEVARRRGESSTSMFYVDTLEYLRRGGRIGAAAAFVGSALSVKPLLQIADGRVAPFEKVRTSGKALARLADVMTERAGSGPVDVGVAHLANRARADELAQTLAERLADNLVGRPVVVGEVGAVLGAHVGPGMVAACVAPRL